MANKIPKRLSDIKNMTEEMEKIVNMYPLSGLNLQQKDFYLGTLLVDILVNDYNNRTLEE